MKSTLSALEFPWLIPNTELSWIGPISAGVFKQGFLVYTLPRWNLIVLWIKVQLNFHPTNDFLTNFQSHLLEYYVITMNTN